MCGWMNDGCIGGGIGMDGRRVDGWKMDGSFEDDRRMIGGRPFLSAPAGTAPPGQPRRDGPGATAATCSAA